MYISTYIYIYVYIYIYIYVYTHIYIYIWENVHTILGWENVHTIPCSIHVCSIHVYVNRVTVFAYSCIEFRGMQIFA